MRYKVYNTVTKCFINDIKDFVLKPDGRLAINEYGDEIGVPYCIPIFFPKENCDSLYIDNVGGVHEGGTGTDTNGNFCGECSNVSCSICPVWKDLSTPELST